MKKILLKATSVLLAFCFLFSATGCQKGTEKSNQEESQIVSVEKKDGLEGEKEETFKPSEYTIQAKDEYIYEYLGLKFQLTEKIKEQMKAKKLAMLDDQSPTDQELSYAMLSFQKMTEEQKNAEISTRGDGYEKWANGLERVAVIGMYKANTPEKDLTKLSQCENHKKIGSSSDGKFDYYLSTKKGADQDLLEEFGKIKMELIEKKDRPENGFVLSEKSDLENTIAYGKEKGDDISGVVTKDINGKAFSKKDLENYDLTMVNVFATWCGPCIREIPELAALQKEMQEKGVNIVGVVTDAVDDQGENKQAIETAKLIQEKTQAAYPFLLPDQTNFNGRLNGIQALPETFFVDKNGKIVGNTYSGARDRKSWEKIIETELEKVKAQEK